MQAALDWLSFSLIFVGFGYFLDTFFYVTAVFSFVFFFFHIKSREFADKQLPPPPRLIIRQIKAVTSTVTSGSF